MKNYKLKRRRGNLKFGGLRHRRRVRRNPHQMFDFMWYTWNIDKAIALIAKRRKKNKDIKNMDVDQIYNAIRWSTPDRPVFAGTNVDPEYALTKADVNKPLVFGLLKDKNTWYSILIDGHHRLYRAHAEGIKNMPAYFLNKRENHHAMVGLRKAPLKRKVRK